MNMVQCTEMWFIPILRASAADNLICDPDREIHKYVYRMNTYSKIILFCVFFLHYVFPYLCSFYIMYFPICVHSTLCISLSVFILHYVFPYL